MRELALHLRVNRDVRAGAFLAGTPLLMIIGLLLLAGLVYRPAPCPAPQPSPVATRSPLPGPTPRPPIFVPVETPSTAPIWTPAPGQGRG